MRSQRGLRPGPRWGSLQCSPRTVAGLRGGKRSGDEGKERKRRGGKEIGRGKGGKWRERGKGGDGIEEG